MRRILVAISLGAVLMGCALAHTKDLLVRPQARPDGLALPLMALGPICGSDHIIGRPIPPISGPVEGCGIAQPVLVSQVHGITLSKPTRMDCPTATALRNWTQAAVLDLVGDYRGGVVRIDVAAGYACRPRNNQAGAKLSEHAKGKAIDISGFTMGDGSRITLMSDWGRGRAARMLRDMHRRACGIFGTVLGPEANAAHADHFHFDTASYRGGSYCR